MVKKIIALGVALVMCLAILIGCGGFTEVNTDDMVDCSLFVYQPAMSWIGDPIELKYPDENAVFECAVDKGYFVLTDPQYVKSAIVKPGEGFYWQPENDLELEHAFVDVIGLLQYNTVKKLTKV